MSDFENKEPIFLRRRPAIIAAALTILAAGTWMAVRSPTNNNTIVFEFQKNSKGGLDTGSGITVGNVTSSGAINMSGSALFADQLTGSGRIKVGGTDGAGLCMADNDGTGCTCVDFNNGTQLTRIGAAADCP